MLNIISTINQDTVNKLVDYLETNINPILGQDVSSYAPGRRRIWLPYEAPLSNARPFEKGLQDDKIWSYLTSVCAQFNWQPELGLISKGGLISPHRDTTFADFRSIGINLGKVTWCYSRSYPMFSWVPDEQRIDPPEVTKLEMTGGEVFEFNCKNVHWTEDVDPNRWGINLWTISKKSRLQFNQFLQSNEV